MDANLLLSNVSSIVKTHALIKQHTGGYFNIFRIAKIDQLEVTICRVLHDLLNPKGSHSQGDLFLREFVARVLQMDFSEEDYHAVQVDREYRIDGDRRIDLLIKTVNYEIPIEYFDQFVDECLKDIKQLHGSLLLKDPKQK